MLVPDLHARVLAVRQDEQGDRSPGYDPQWTKQVLEGFKMRSNPKRWQAASSSTRTTRASTGRNIFVVEWVPTGRVSFLRKVS